MPCRQCRSTVDYEHKTTFLEDSTIYYSPTKRVSTAALKILLLVTRLLFSKLYGVMLGVSVAALEALLCMFSYCTCDGWFQLFSRASIFQCDRSEITKTSQKHSLQSYSDISVGAVKKDTHAQK